MSEKQGRLARLRQGIARRPGLAGGVISSPLVLAVVIEIIASQTNNQLATISPWLAGGVSIVLIALYVLGRLRTAHQPDPISARTAMPHPLELHGRDTLVPEAVDKARAQGIVIVHGPAGIGTSSIAVHAACELAPLRHYTDLRGPDPSAPESELSVATRVLVTLGLPADEIGAADEAFPRIEQVLRKSGSVLVLDNVDNWQQIHRLALPIEGSWIVVAGHLDVDEAPPGIPRVHVDYLEPEAALRVMRDQMAAFAGAEPQQARALAETYLRSPSTITDVARWLKHNEGVTLAMLLDDLRGIEDDYGQAALGFILARQLEGATDQARRVLAHLVAAPVAELGAAAAAELTGESRDTVEIAMNDLISRRLVERVGPHRYRTIDAARPAAPRLRARERDRAWRRLISYYAAQTETYATLLLSGDDPAARQWFETEDTSLLETLRTAADRPRKAVKAAAAELTHLADALDHWFELEQRPSFRATAAKSLAAVGEAVGDATVRVTAQLRLSAIARAAGDHREAVRRWERAVELWPRREWIPQMHAARAAHLMTTTDDFPAMRRALAEYRAALPAGDRAGLVVALVNQASFLLLRGQSRHAAEHTKAVDDYTQAKFLLKIALGEEPAALRSRARAEELLGIVAHLLNQPELASRHWSTAADAYHRLRDPHSATRCRTHPLNPNT